MLAMQHRMGAGVSGFGRKGLEGQQRTGLALSHPAQAGIGGLRNAARAPFQPQPASSETSRNVEAFIAAERARRAQAGGEGGISDAATGYRSSDRPERSLPLAYLLWFILAQVSAHRFYLGAYRSAFAQVGLFAFWVGLALMTPKDSFDTVGPVVAIALIAWALWVLADVFFIHRIHRKLCRKPGSAAEAFA